MENGNKTKKSEYFEDGSEENSGETLNKEKSKLKFYLNLGSVIILGLLLLICGLSLFIPLDIPSFSLREDGFLISIFQFGPSTDYFVCNAILILIPFILIIVELSSFLKYRKKSSTSSIFFIGMAIAVLKMDSGLDYLGGTFVALLIFGIVLSFVNIGINVFSIIKYSEKKITKRNIVYFAISLASLAVSASIFFIDFNIINDVSTFAVSTSFSEALSDTKRYLIFSNDNFYLIYVGLLFSLLVILAAALFAKAFENLITDSEECDSNVKKTGLLTFIIPLLFFVFTLVNRIVVSSFFETEISSGLGSTIVPLTINGLFFIVQCFFIGKKVSPNEENKDEEENKVDYNKLYPTLKENITIVIFSVAFFACFIVAYFLKFLVIDAYDAGLDFYETFSCHSVVSDTNENSSALAVLGFIFITLLSVNITLLVISLCSVFSKSKSFGSVSRGYIVTSFTSVFALWIISNYYLAFIKTTPAFIEVLFPEIDTIYPGLDTDIAHFIISSEILGPFVLSAVLIVAFVILKPITKLENILDKKKMAMEMAYGNGPIGGNYRRSSNYANRNKEEDGVGKVSLVDDETSTFDNCPAFTELDNKIEAFNKELKKGQAAAFKNLSLPSLVEFVVEYAKNSRLHLSYSKKDIATFVAGLAACKLSILQGMSGTGKTSLPKIFLEALMGNCEIVEVESSWRDKNELLGFYNDFSKVYSPKKFTRALYKAALNPNIITFIVLDEMNLSRIEYYFSDFLSLMENEEDKREIRLTNASLFNTYDGEKHSYKALKENHTIVIPKNIWFIGTANRDESTFEISDKVYDRGYTMNFDKRAPAITDFDEEMQPQFVEYSLLRKLFNSAPSIGFSIEKCPQILECEKLLRPYNISFGNRIARQIETFVNIYCNCFREPNKHIDEAVETILLSKVVHKLEYKNVTNKAELIHAFKKLNLFKCVEFIETLSEDF